MRVEQLSANPELTLIYDFVSATEAYDLVTVAIGKFARSSTVCSDPNGCAVPERTSSSAALPPSTATASVSARGIALARAAAAEPIQVVRYLPGQEFRPHHDAFDESEGGMRARAMHGGVQRYATILIYLYGPTGGGETVFPELGLSVAPIQHAALFWRNLHADGTPDARLLHGGAPVRSGVKYAANLWLRGRDDPMRDWRLGGSTVFR